MSNIDINLTEVVEKEQGRRKVAKLVQENNGVIPLEELGNTRIGAWWNGNKYVIPTCTCAMGLVYDKRSHKLKCPQCKKGGKESDEVPHVK